ncbi:MAG: N-acetyltransferase family protein [Saprospiraceae bacterium]
MKFQPQTYKLKKGSTITIRVAEKEDVQKLMGLKRGYIKNTTTIPMQLDEYPIDLEKELNLITEYEISSNSILLVAELNDELIGNIDLTGSKRSKMFHTGMIGMGIKEEWRNQGLGRFLIESVIHWAKKHSKLELIWLDVYASNKLGYNLYKKTGFEVSGTIKGFFKQENGYIDKIQMYQRIKENIEK